MLQAERTVRPRLWCGKGLYLGNEKRQRGGSVVRDEGEGGRRDCRNSLVDHGKDCGDFLWGNNKSLETFGMVLFALSKDCLGCSGDWLGSAGGHYEDPGWRDCGLHEV